MNALAFQDVRFSGIRGAMPPGECHWDLKYSKLSVFIFLVFFCILNLVDFYLFLLSFDIAEPEIEKGFTFCT